MKKIALAIVLVMLCAVLLSAKNPASTNLSMKPETISGTLAIVSPVEASKQQLIFVKAANGITYDFHIGPATKISAAGRKMASAELSGQIGKEIEVVFRPLKTGNAAIAVNFK